MQQKCCSSWPLLQQEQVGPDLHDVWKQHKQISQSLKVLVSQVSPIKMNVAQERMVKASKWSVWNVCWVFHGLSAALWALQSSHKNKKQEKKYRGNQKPEAKQWGLSTTACKECPCTSQKMKCEESSLASAGSSGWGHEGVQGGREAEARLCANTDNQGDQRKETTKLCSKHRD